MRVGVRLFANLYRPAAAGPHPVIMSVTPYGNDKHPDRVANFFMQLAGVKFGKLHCSRLTSFESPDRIYWVQQRDAVLQADVRGTGLADHNYTKETRAENSSRATSNASRAIWTTRAASDQDTYL